MSKQLNVTRSILPAVMVQGQPVACDAVVASALATLGAVREGRVTHYGASLSRNELISLCAIVVVLKVTAPERVQAVASITRHSPRNTINRMPPEYLWAMRRIVDVEPSCVGEVYQYLSPDSFTTRAVAFTYVRDDHPPLMFYRY